MIRQNIFSWTNLVVQELQKFNLSKNLLSEIMTEGISPKSIIRSCKSLSRWINCYSVIVTGFITVHMNESDLVKNIHELSIIFDLFLEKMSNSSQDWKSRPAYVSKFFEFFRMFCLIIALWGLLGGPTTGDQHKNRQ